MPSSPDVPLSRQRRIMDPIREFLQAESAGGFALIAATIVALIWANSPWSPFYFDLWHRDLALPALGITEDYRHWVNDGLMAVFFFVVALEIKRELVTGELRNPRTAALPVALALGGMVLPAVLFTALTAGTPEVRGWAVPTATDIAFAAAVLGLAAKRAPSGLRLVLLSLAIVDDLGAILVIALFYSHGIFLEWLAGAAAVIAGILALRRIGMSRPWMYLVPALVLWYCTFRSGIHPTLAGVALGLLTPAGEFRGRRPLEDLEHRVHPVAGYLVLPLFALANAGVVLGGPQFTDALDSRLTWAVVLGLSVGKPLGVMIAGWTALRLRVATMPAGMTLRDLWPVGLIAGIGFTVSLFIAGLSFEGGALDQAKAGILLGSLVSAAAGVVVLRSGARSRTTGAGHLARD